ncbi:hypothetical protein QBC35DRAFT_65102 [Podospora australis]|uniref:UBZ4-type domain-containing protein n=1 Tax=Podospora australis TaxID=1536484 RepID=A0AAN7AEG4_9PEZI|nr:hypothetical protein QBC35DRAFT_65102 [Podospora australis]
MPRVPTTREVIPGARANIILKADQPTGRTVSGIIKDVLTRGDHHRGIKVRLVDGRIGRVQSMAPQSQSETSDAPDSADGITGDHQEQVSMIGETGGRTRARGGARFRFESDVRTDGFAPPPSSALGLDAYIKPAKQKKGRGGGTTSTTNTSTATSSSDTAPAGEISTCPVCNDFTGDETAISHHVASHFDD